MRTEKLAMTRRRVLGWLGGVAGWPVWRTLGLGSATAGCAAHASRSEGVNGLEVKKSWRIPLGDAPRYGELIAWAPDNRRLAVGGVANKRMSIWDVRELRRVPVADDQSFGVQALAYSPDGRYLAVKRGTAGQGKERYSVSIRDAQSAVIIQALVDDTGEVRPAGGGSMSFSLDSRYLAVAYNTTTALYEVDSGGLWHRVGGLGPGAHRVAISQDGSTVVIFRASGREIVVCRIPSMEVLRKWTSVGGPDFGFHTLAYRPNRSEIATGHGPDLGIYDPATGTLLRHLRPDPPTWVGGLAYSPNGRLLAASVGRKIQIFDTDSWSLVSTLYPQAGPVIHDVAFSADGHLLAASAGIEIVIWEFAKQE
jgi:WD40 repeat protein